MVSVCQGEALAVVSQGCVDAAACQVAAEEMGLQLGNDKLPFEGDWSDKGCYYYPADHPLYPNQAYFGTAGSCSELRITPQAGAKRVSCDGTTLPPFDPSRCAGEYCVTMEGCREAALAMGLKLGSTQYPFVGNYPIKGCTYFPSTDPQYPNEAYWGSGASICGQLRAEPTDGSIRLGCEGFEDAVLEDPEETGTQGSNQATEGTEVSNQTLSGTSTGTSGRPTGTSMSQPASRPVQQPETVPTLSTLGFNETSPSASPNLEDEIVEDDKNDKDGTPGTSISAFQSENVSAAPTTQLAWVLSFFAVISFVMG